MTGKRGGTLLFDACPKSTWVGIHQIHDSKAPGGITFYPGIDLYYEPEDLPVILSVAEEMDSLERPPVVYMNLVQFTIDTLVMFDLKTDDLSFLKPLMNPLIASVLEEATRDQGIRIVMASATDVSGKLLPNIMEFYELKGFFAVQICEEVPGEPDKPRTLWATKLKSINWDPIPSFIDF
ncbi:hypothetical protein A2841_00050 [Candidatus Kaiserbacteria bacterium RIFCSPHIGHO2_01_FULL_48_10]|uniref:Uncharacterized protein n=1 Tax=Candidatus Kaiserbacteria bacterium RIFCSPHIGHO2_01_FULL_48_10 TaxID=1798476 RepID=A0A1F6C5Q9_9BACT|nr:MAG: hypothetical protein A2841_00050 [Candidatus Kaiserbacteria bacterium RIFCSPHIGHO2_01_FULL_48_10]HLC99546.1 hypothetical protein [Patescibacteria group bacterium]